MINGVCVIMSMIFYVTSVWKTPSQKEDSSPETRVQFGKRNTVQGALFSSRSVSDFLL